MNLGAFSLMQWPQDRSAAQVFGDEIAQAVEAERQSVLSDPLS